MQSVIYNSLLTLIYLLTIMLYSRRCIYRDYIFYQLFKFHSRLEIYNQIIKMTSIANLTGAFYKPRYSFGTRDFGINRL